MEEMEHHTVQSEEYIPKLDPNGLEIHEARYEWCNQREFEFACVSHYTSIDSAIKILTSEGLSFRLSRYDSMNDPKDCRLAEEEVWPIIREIVKDFPSYNEEKENEHIYPYVLSFSKSVDSLDMWRLYHSEVALVIDIKAVLAPFKEVEGKKSLLIADECRYCSNKDEILQTAVELFNQSGDLGTYHEIVQLQFTLIKNKEFSTENEFRIVIYDQDCFEAHLLKGDTNPTIEDKEIPRGVDAYCRANGQLVLFKTLVLPKEALKKIILRIDSHEEFSQMKKKLEVLLTQRCYHDVKIEKSQSPSFKETH